MRVNSMSSGAGGGILLLLLLALLELEADDEARGQVPLEGDSDDWQVCRDGSGLEKA